MVKRKWGPGNPLWEWKNKHKAHKKSKRGLRTMTRHRKRGRSKGLLGGGLMKSALIGAVIGYMNIGSKVPVVNGTPYANAATAMGASYLLGGKSIKSMGIAALVAQFLPSVLGSTQTTTSNSSFVSGY